jgi:hypothetical protein
LIVSSRDACNGKNRKVKFEKSARLNVPVTGMSESLWKGARLGAGAGFEPATFRL